MTHHSGSQSGQFSQSVVRHPSRQIELFKINDNSTERKKREMVSVSLHLPLSYHSVSKIDRFLMGLFAVSFDSIVPPSLVGKYMSPWIYPKHTNEDIPFIFIYLRSMENWNIGHDRHFPLTWCWKNYLVVANWMRRRGNKMTNLI